LGARSLRPRAGHIIAVAELALVETSASFARMAREAAPRLTLPRRNRVISDFERCFRQWYVVEVNRALLMHASTLCQTHPLRAYDAVQLACALIFRDEELAAGRPAPVFVCADTQLLTIASAEGLGAENPNLHP
jgi:hypothetical protein